MGLLQYKAISPGYIETNIVFSICTIVNDLEEYGLMKQSFEQCGFVQGCEYLIADNTVFNAYDAYQAIGLFLKQSTGRYLIVVHQDVRCVDTRKELVTCLENVAAKTPDWAICGNAGAKGYHQEVIYITYNSHTEKYTDLPEAVNSLDENFLVFNKASNITISADLTGFHLYGTDLCITARFLGYHCYVIPFMVRHLSKGNLSSLENYKNYFTDAYARKLSVGYMQTTCTQFYLSNSMLKNKICNWPPFFFIIKQFKRYPYLISKKRNAGKIIKG